MPIPPRKDLYEAAIGFFAGPWPEGTTDDQKVTSVTKDCSIIIGRPAVKATVWGIGLKHGFIREPFCPKKKGPNKHSKKKLEGTVQSDFNPIQVLMQVLTNFHIGPKKLRDVGVDSEAFEKFVKSKWGSHGDDLLNKLRTFDAHPRVCFDVVEKQIQSVISDYEEDDPNSMQELLHVTKRSVDHLRKVQKQQEEIAKIVGPALKKLQEQAEAIQNLQKYVEENKINT